MALAQSVHELPFGGGVRVSRVQHPGNVVEVGVVEDGAQVGVRAIEEAQDRQGRDAGAELGELAEVRVAGHLHQAVLDPLHRSEVLLGEDVAGAGAVEQQQALR